MKSLAHKAFKSENTFGRALSFNFDRDVNLSSLDPSLVDLIKILNSKTIRRLRGKTQVISRPSNTHVRDRLIHSLEVSALAIQIGARLELNVPLIQASAMGHDLGHVVFGHLGESFIAKQLGENFRHESFGVFVLEIIERNGLGLNLSYETLHAIRNHSRGSGRMAVSKGPVLEDDVLMICDKLSYIFSDYNDIRRIKFNSLNVPDELFKLGNNQTECLRNCAEALCRESLEKGVISFEDSEEARCFNVVRDFMYQEVYHKMYREKLKVILDRVFLYLKDSFEDLRSAALALALMSEDDVYALNDMINNFDNDFILTQLSDISIFAVAEFLPKIPKLAKLNFCNCDKFLDKNYFGKIPKLECFAM